MYWHTTPAAVCSYNQLVPCILWLLHCLSGHRVLLNMYIVLTQHYQSNAFIWRKYHTYCLLVGLNITRIIRYFI
jgi:hypothetical protein